MFNHLLSIFGETVYVQANQSLLEQAAPVFIGAIVAFVFSILLFYFTESWKSKRGQSQLEDNVSREIAYNIQLLEKMKIEFDRWMQSVSANDTDIFPAFRFNKVQKQFVSESFNSGLLYKKLTDEEISTIDNMFEYCDISTSNFLWDQFEEFRNSKMQSKELLKRLRFNVDEIVRYADFLKLISPRFKRTRAKIST